MLTLNAPRGYGFPIFRIRQGNRKVYDPEHM